MASPIEKLQERVKGSVSVTFSYRCNASIAVELDADLNDDKSCFLYGETVYFRMYSIPSRIPVDIYTSMGNAVLNNNFLSENVEDQEAAFTDEKSFTVTKPIITGPSNVRWFGNDWGPLVKVDQGTMRASAATDEKILAQHVANCMYDYTTEYRSGYLNGVYSSEDKVNVTVYIIERE